jgi:tryptophan synthase alpha subunit
MLQEREANQHAQVGGKWIWRPGAIRSHPVCRSEAAHLHDANLREDGVLMGIAVAPVQKRNHQAGRVETSEGSFMASAMPVAGFAAIEAADLAQEIKMVSKTPCAVGYGVVQAWPLVTGSQ